MVYRFYNNCVNWPRQDVPALLDMVDSSIDITRATFLKHVDRDELQKLESALGYDHYLSMAQDWHVSYHRSRLHGRRVYYFKWSGIEYVFTPTPELKRH